MPVELTYEKFLESLELAPRLTVELLVENLAGALFLTLRDKPPYEGQCHLPGGFLMKGETIDDCANRVAKRELGLEFKSKGTSRGLFENIDGDPRGHLLHYTLRYGPDCINQEHMKPDSEGRFFDEIPQNTIYYQRDFLKKIGYKISPEEVK